VTPEQECEQLLRPIEPMPLDPEDGLLNREQRKEESVYLHEYI
jgi:hypothetical protein